MTLHELLDIIRDDTVLHILFDRHDVCGFVMRAPEARQLRIEGVVRSVWDDRQNLTVVLNGNTLRALAPVDQLDRIEKSMINIFGP